MTHLQIGSVCLQLQRKAIKNLYIRVLPPDGQVQVAAPLQMSEADICMVINGRLPWIKKQQDKFSQQTQAVSHEMHSGEYHYLWGKAYRLEVLERVGRHEVYVSGDKLYLCISPKTSAENRLLVLQEFYRTELKSSLEKMLVHWQKKMGVTASSFGIKQMKTRWGSCNTGTKKIWLNLELAKKPLVCVEYVLVHELAHLLEPSHNHRFKAYMSQFLPNWQERKALLNTMLLANELSSD